MYIRIIFFFSRAKNRVWFGMLATKEFAMKTYKNLEQRIRLECDGQVINLPALQGIVVLNIPSYAGGTNFWGGRSANEVTVIKTASELVLIMFVIIMITSLFTKLPWPGDSEGTFRSSSQTAICTHVYHSVEASHCPFLSLNVWQ